MSKDKKPKNDKDQEKKKDDKKNVLLLILLELRKICDLLSKDEQPPYIT
jgi:hypothetical protein